jgi:hypothetical protein
LLVAGGALPESWSKQARRALLSAMAAQRRRSSGVGDAAHAAPARDVNTTAWMMNFMKTRP